MSEHKKDKQKTKLFAKFFGKLKAIKHIEVFISIIFIVIILLIYFSGGNAQIKTATNEENKLSSTIEYVKETEERVKMVLSKIKGVGEVSVMINCESGYALKVAYTTETTKKSENSVIIETVTQTPVLVTNNGETTPIVLEYVSPKINNIIIVASGAENTNVKLELIKAVESLLGIPASSIQVFTGN